MSNNDAVQPVDEISPASEELKAWVVNIEARLDNSTEEIPPTRPPTKKIPSIYGNWKCFDDHFRNVPFLPETNMWQFVAFMKQSYNLNVQAYLEKLHEKEDDLWSYYEGADEEFRAENSKHFIEYLLANSCFLIIALVILTDRIKLIENFLGSGQKLKRFIYCERMGIQRYMLTMDYQIPWFVVETVYTDSNISSKINTPIHELVISVFNFIDPGVPKSKLHNNTIMVPQDGFQHLLHIFHWSRTPEGKFHKINPLLYINSFFIPSAKSMQFSATVFDKCAASGFDMTFHERILSGVMHLPIWSHFLHENEIYKNLLAFEQGYGIVSGFPVTSYIACIVCLGQTLEDFKLLGAKKIMPIPRDQKDFVSSLQGYKAILLSNDIHMSDDLFNLSKIWTLTDVPSAILKE